MDRVLSVRVVLRPGLDEAGVAGEVEDRLVRRLRAELAELDVESAALVPGAPAPDGAKGADPATVGAIVVAMSASGGVFALLIGTLRDWLGRQSARHRIAVTIDGDTIELDGASADQQQALVDAYVQRHAGR